MRLGVTGNLRWVWVLIALLGGGLAAPLSRAQSGMAVIEMTNALKFVPNKVTIPAGRSVEWYNASDLVHTVTDDPAKAARPGDAVLPEGAGPFDSGSIGSGDRYRHTFTVPGIYRYFCMPHEGAGMVGTIVVTQ